MTETRLVVCPGCGEGLLTEEQQAMVMHFGCGEELRRRVRAAVDAWFGRVPGTTWRRLLLS
jgi:hypothetical protein